MLRLDRIRNVGRSYWQTEAGGSFRFGQETTAELEAKVGGDE